MRDPIAEAPHLHDANYYRLAYQLSAQRLNTVAGVLPHDDRLTTSDEVVELLREWLAEAIAFSAEVTGVLRWHAQLEGEWRKSRLRRLRKYPLTAKDQRLRQFLSTTVAPCAELVVAGSYVFTGEPGLVWEWSAPVRERARRGQLSYRAHYDLACLDSSIAGVLTGALDDYDDDPQPSYLASSLASLRRSFELSTGRRRQELIGWAKDDPSLRPVRDLVPDEFAGLVEEFGYGARDRRR
ncbi:MAG TPA: hypothetical protein VHF90_01760 [Thermoleophilaceae bacterium]|nr:hypothetical protein [Thermoleophilaceae bacterium]